MKGLDLPEITEDFTADPVELFFDLAYVFAFSQLVGFLVHDPTWAGAGKAALLFGLLWLPWQQLTWSANAVSGNGRPIRVIFLAATVVSVPMAASTSTALTAGGPVFAVALGAIMIIGFVIQFMSSERGTESRTAVVRWVTPTLLAVAVLLVGASVEGTARIWVWCLSLSIVLAAMIAAGRQEWVIRMGHFAERHGLIVIIALGEVIVAIGIPVVAALQQGSSLRVATVAALLASGMFACVLWWSYFDKPSPGLEHRGTQLQLDRERGRYARDIYTWLHAPLVAGIILSATSLEQIALHPDDPVPDPFRIMLATGLGFVYVSIAAGIWRAYRFVAWERVITAAAIALAVTATAGTNGLIVLGIVVAVMIGMLIIEGLRVDETAKG